MLLYKPYKLLTIFTNCSPLSYSFLNHFPNEARAGEKRTISPFFAIFIASSTHSFRVFLMTTSALARINFAGQNLRGRADSGTPFIKGDLRWGNSERSLSVPV